MQDECLPPSLPLKKASSPSPPYSYHRLELSASLHVVAILQHGGASFLLCFLDILSCNSRKDMRVTNLFTSATYSFRPRLERYQSLHASIYWHWLTGHSLFEFEGASQLCLPSFGKAGFSIHILLIGFAMAHVGIKLLLYILFNGSFFR